MMGLAISAATATALIIPSSGSTKPRPSLRSERATRYAAGANEVEPYNCEATMSACHQSRSSFV